LEGFKTGLPEIGERLRVLQIVEVAVPLFSVDSCPASVAAASARIGKALTIRVTLTRHP
jgi:hypothetical protein